MAITEDTSMTDLIRVDSDNEDEEDFEEVAIDINSAQDKPILWDTFSTYVRIWTNYPLEFAV